MQPPVSVHSETVMDSIRATYIFTFVGMAAMLYFMVNENNITGSKAQKSSYGKIAYRDPKLIENHKALLHEKNQKKKL